jgi:hypothetical protein
LEDSNETEDAGVCFRLCGDRASDAARADADAATTSTHTTTSRRRWYELHKPRDWRAGQYRHTDRPNCLRR